MKYCCIFFLFLTCSLCVNAQVNVKFELQDIPKHTDVGTDYFIAGNFNNWMPNDTLFKFLKTLDGKYTLLKQLPVGQYEFKITRGNWSKVEVALQGGSLPNRVISLKKDTSIVIKVQNWSDEFKAVLPKHTASKHVKLMDSVFFRRIWVYLPPSYASTGKKYPVLYMHDGQNLFDTYTSGYGEWGVDEVLDSLIAKGAPECIVIGVDNAGAERMREYNPYDSKFGEAKGKQYVDFLANTLKPYVDKNYRTQPDVKHTSIAGSSMGGLISMYAIAMYPKIYGKAGIFSPAFWIGKKIEEDVKTALPTLKTSKIYLVAGTLEGDEMISDMKSVYQLLNPTGKNKNIKVVEKADGQHKEWFWHREFTDFYRFISK